MCLCLWCRYVASWEAVVDGLDQPDLGLGDPAAGFSLIRHVAEGWTQVDDALQHVTRVQDDIGNDESCWIVLLLFMLNLNHFTSISNNLPQIFVTGQCFFVCRRHRVLSVAAWQGAASQHRRLGVSVRGSDSPRPRVQTQHHRSNTGGWDRLPPSSLRYLIYFLCYVSS